MTLQQLKYIIQIVQCGSITMAAQKLYITQPSLSKAVSELEQEMGITIFLRSNRGVILSEEGTKFLSYARQVVEQAELLEQTYKYGEPVKRVFAVSSQHYAFAVNAFVALIKEYGKDKYEFSLRELRTNDIIEDVRTQRSELGILFLSHFNRPKNIIVSDRATLFNLLIGLNGYTISSGILSSDLNGTDIASIPLESEECMEIGYIHPIDRPLSQMAQRYLEHFRTYIANYQSNQ